MVKIYSLILNLETLFFEPISDISFYPNILPYTTSSVRVALKITHGCLENSTNRIETTFPDRFTVKPEFKHGWTTNLQTNTFPSTFSNITWYSNDVSNNIPDGLNELFWVWITYPSTYQFDTKYYAPTVQHCYPSGQYKWIDTVSSEYLAPYFTISSSNVPDNDTNNKTFSRIDILSISTSIISIITFLITFWYEYRKYQTKKLQNQTKKLQAQEQIKNVSTEKQIEITDIERNVSEKQTENVVVKSSEYSYFN
jgi:uncharacterized protein YcnI